MLKLDPRAPRCHIYLICIPGGDDPSALGLNECVSVSAKKDTFVRSLGPCLSADIVHCAQGS